jgi:hypothetical protein
LGKGRQQVVYRFQEGCNIFLTLFFVKCINQNLQYFNILKKQGVTINNGKTTVQAKQKLLQSQAERWKCVSQKDGK